MPLRSERIPDKRGKLYANRRITRRVLPAKGRLRPCWSSSIRRSRLLIRRDCDRRSAYPATSELPLGSRASDDQCWQTVALSVARWATDKHHLADLARRGVPVVPSQFIEPGESAEDILGAWLDDGQLEGEMAAEFMLKPTIGSYAKNVKTLLGRTISASLHARPAIAAGGAKRHRSTVLRFGRSSWRTQPRVFRTPV